MTHELRAVESEEDWATYHSIRRRVLWEARGQFGVYDQDHPDERSLGNHPLLLVYSGDCIGVVRVDVAGETAYFRRVAIREDVQRRGHGRKLLTLAEEFARESGCVRARSDVDPQATGFYREAGYSEHESGPHEGSVPMEILL